MNARIASRAAATAAVAALLLTGCGSDDDGGDPPPSDGKIEGAQTDDQPSDEPSDEQAAAPQFDLPDDVKVEITDDETGDAKKDAILRDHAYALMAQQEAFAAGESTENFKRYWGGVAANKYEASFKEYREDGATITGLDRFYFREVTSLEGTRAVVAYCEDQTKAFDKDVETGKVERTEPSLDSYIDVRSTMEKGTDGWKIVDITGQRGSQECRDKA